MDVNPNLLQQLFDALDARNYLLAVPLLVLGLIWFVRMFLRHVPKVGPWIAGDMGGAVFGILGAVAQGVIVAAALPGEHRPSQVIVAVVGFLFVNQTFFASLKKLGIDLSVDPPQPGEKLPTPGTTAGTGLAILLVCTLTLPGCAFFKPLQPKLVHCATDPGGKAVIEVGDALDLPTRQETEAKLEGLALSYGIDVVVCIVGVIVEGLENYHPNGGAGAICEQAPCPIAPEVKLIRAYRFLDRHNASPQLR